MGFRDVPLNDAQLEVLRWIGDGCPDDVYHDWSHRSSARALSNRGLVTVEGHGSKWRAMLTESGTYYLAHGTYPLVEDAEPVEKRAGDPDDDLNSKEGSPSTELSEPKPLWRIRQVKAVPRQPRRAHEAKAHKPNVTEQLMFDLEHAESHEIKVPYDQTRRYKMLAAFAKRSGRIPEGMRITVESSWSRSDVAVRLKPLPAWQLKKLTPVSVPAQLRNPSDVTALFKNSDTFQVKGDSTHRTCS